MVSFLDLPNELLLEVMEYCEFLSWLSLSATCKRLNELLSQSPRLMNQIPLRLDAKTKKYQKILMESKRKYSYLQIFHFLPDVHLPLLEKFGKNVKDSIISGFQIGLNDLKIILNCCPNIEELSMFWVGYIDGNNVDNSIILPKLTNLKKLCFSDTNLKLIQILTSAQITNFCLSIGSRHNLVDTDISAQVAELIKFLQTQKNLKSFGFVNITRVDTKNFFALDISENFKSQLKRLDIADLGSDVNHRVAKSVSKFLRGQTNLEEVRISITNSLSAADYDHLLTKNPKLKTLSLDIRHYIINNRKCASVKNLEVTHANPWVSLREENEAKRCRINDLLAEFPNVEVLELSNLPYLDYQKFKLIADTMMNLTELTIIGTQNSISFDGIKFPSLKSLRLKLTWMITEDSFKSFLENNKQITHLEIIECNYFTDSIMQLIVDNLKDLESLEIEGLNEFTQKILLMIAENLTKLKTLRLEVHGKKFDDYSVLNSIQGLRLFVKTFGV